MSKLKFIVPLLALLFIMVGVVSAASPAKIRLQLEETAPVLLIGETTNLILRWENQGNSAALNAQAQCEYDNELRDRPKLTPFFAGGDPRNLDVVAPGQQVEGFISFVANDIASIEGYCYIAYIDSKSGEAKRTKNVDWRFDIVIERDGDDDDDGDDD